MTPCSARIRLAATRSSIKFICFLAINTQSRLLALDARSGDHTRPARKFSLHQVAEALRRAAGRRHALFCEKLADLALFEQSVHFRVYLGDHRPRRPGGRKHAIPGLDLKVGKAQL